MEGWIKLHRKSLESAVFQNPNLWQVWSYCLMRANHKDMKILWNGNEIVLRKGQFITGRFQGSKDCNMNPNTFYLKLKTLEQLSNISINSNNKNSIITVINWASYQGQDEINNNKITTKQQQNNTDKNGKNKLIVLALPLIQTVNKKQSLYSIIGKYKKELGEDKLNNILAECSERGNTFVDETKLAAYLETCLKSNGSFNPKSNSDYKFKFNPYEVNNG